ncbi:hypothetical protein [Mariniplasma anaerobium]|uniref:Lipoprotein n=1 Tax=Mariniplasma anaerobium TaxID=2735436 RepID=A0A7U9TL85_9MOLU|nr:hypothetical protein [Mariniplasma anaerobium]BCR35457.1 hypothetical protein MPAN_003500 [Mariniplasma anaerobium]
MNQLKSFRRFALLVLVVASVLTLAACNGSEKTPYGSISSDDVYLTYGDLKVTEKELYDQLRMQGAATLATMVDEEIFKTQITAAKADLIAGDETLIEYLDDTVNSAIYGVTDKEDLQGLYDDNPELYIRNIEKYADSVYLLDNSIVIQDVIDAILGLAQTEDNPFTGYQTLDFLLERYALRVAQRAYAKELLAVEVLDEESDAYISDENIVTYYKNNKEGQYDVDALVVRFINLNEANAALYQVGLKPDSKGFWYALPDIRIKEGNAGYVDLDNPDYAYVSEILDDLDITSKLGVDGESREMITVDDYEDYYKAYVINTDRNDGFSDVKLLPDGVKAKYIEIYNLLNPAAPVKLDTDGISIVGDGNDYTTTYTYDDLTEINTSLRSHIYDTLIAEADMEDTDDTTDGKPYSSRIQTFGDSRYLVFKLNDESETEEGILIEDPENSDAEIFDDSTAALAVKAEMKDELIESKLTDTYISTKVNEMYEEETLDIYDGVVRLFYEQSYGYDGDDSNKTGDVLAKMGDIEILVDDFYSELESSYGINIALDMLSNKFLMASEDYTVSDADMDDYTEQFENIISQFSADNFASSGYPASLGRQDFLLIAFGSSSNDEAIENLYVYPDLRQQYLEDYEVHFENANIYQSLATLAEKQYNNFESITVSHLLVYFDQNGDGSPDNPQDYLDTLDAVAKQEVLDGLVDLVDLIYTQIGMYKGFSEALTAIATDFNNSGRIEIGSTTPPYDYTLESLWAEYRQLGFYLKFENISSAITNKSNFVTGTSVLDQVFYDRAMVIHDTLAAMDDDDSLFPYLDFYDAWVTTSNAVNQAAMESVQSDFGFHLILATKVAETTSAMYDGVNDTDGDYVLADNETLNAYNVLTDTLSASQIEYYLVGSLSDEGVELPTDVQTAITNYLDPVLTVYQGTYMQRELIFSLLEDAVFTDAANNLRIDEIREINLRQLNGYMLSENGGVYDANYDALFGDLIDILEGNA